jgi:hypothetical protein
MTTVQWLTNAGGIPPTAAVVLGPDGNYYIADYNSPKWYLWDGQSGSSYTTTDMSSYTSYGFLGIEYSSVSGNNLTLIAHDGTILTNSSGSTGSWTASNPVTSGGMSWETCAGYSGGYLLSSYYGRIIDLSGTVLTTLTDWGIFRPFSSFVVIGSYAYLIAGVGSSQQLWAVDLSTGTPTKILSAPFINGISRNGLTCTLSDQIVGGLSSPTWMSFLEQQNQICVLEGTSVNLYNWGGSSPVATISPSTPTGTTLQKVFANGNTIVIVGETSSTSFPVYFYTLSGGTWTNTGTITASSSVGWVEIQGSSAFILTSSNTIPVSYSGTSWTANASLDIVSTGNAVIDPTGNYAVIPTSSNLTSLLLTSTGWNVNGETPVSGIVWVARDTVTNDGYVYANNGSEVVQYLADKTYTTFTEQFAIPFQAAAPQVFYVRGGRILSSDLDQNISSIWCPFTYAFGGQLLSSGVLTVAHRNIMPEANLYTYNTWYFIGTPFMNPFGSMNGYYFGMTPTTSGPYGYRQIELDPQGQTVENLSFGSILNVAPNISYTLSLYNGYTTSSTGGVQLLFSTTSLPAGNAMPGILNDSYGSFPNPANAAPGFYTGSFSVSTGSWAASTAYSRTSLIVDSNGNIQAVQTPGTSSTTEPVWATTPYSTTTDGTVTWILIALGSDHIPFYLFADTLNNSYPLFEPISFGNLSIKPSSTPTSVIGYRIVGDTQAQLIVLPNELYSISGTTPTSLGTFQNPLFGYQNILTDASGNNLLFTQLPVNTLASTTGMAQFGGASPNGTSTQVGLGAVIDNSGNIYVFNTMGGSFGKLT